MRIPSGTTDQVIYFVALDATDLKTRETGLTTFTVYRARNGGTSTAMTTPTVSEVDATNQPGVYSLLLDEDMTIGSGNDSEEMIFHITHAGMAPVDRTIELYRPKITVGNTLGVAADGDISGNVDGSVASVVAGVTVTTNNDKTGYTASTVTDKTGYSISGTKTTLDALNDIAATAIVSGGAITTSGGAVSTVSTVTNGVTVTTNNDKTGYSLTQSFPVNFADLAITATTGLVSVGTNNDKSGYSISGTKTTLDVLNDIASTDIVTAGAITTLSGAVVNVDTVDTCTTNLDMRGTDGANTIAPDNATISSINGKLPALVGGRIDASVGAYQTGLQPFDVDRSTAQNGTYGQTIKLLHEWVGNQFAVDDVSPTTTQFDTTFPNKDLTGMAVGFVNGATNSNLSRIVESWSWTGTHSRLTFSSDEAWPQAPTNGDNIVLNVAAGYAHTLSKMSANIEANTSVGDLADGARLDLIFDAINSGTNKLISGVIESNTVVEFDVQLVDASGNPVASQAVTVQKRLDGASVSGATGTATNTDAYGLSHFTSSTADTNGTKSVTFIFSATGAKDAVYTFMISS